MYFSICVHSQYLIRHDSASIDVFFHILNTTSWPLSYWLPVVHDSAHIGTRPVRGVIAEEVGIAIGKVMLHAKPVPNLMSKILDLKTSLNIILVWKKHFYGLLHFFNDFSIFQKVYYIFGEKVIISPFISLTKLFYWMLKFWAYYKPFFIYRYQ